MVRRVVLGLAIVGLCGTLASAAPKLIIEEQGSNLSAGGYVAGQSYTFNVYVQDLSQAITSLNQNLGSLGGYGLTFRMEQADDASAVDNSDQSAINIDAFRNVWAPTTPAGPGTVILDTDLDPGGSNQAVDGGGVGFFLFGIADPIGDAKTKVAEFDITIGPGGDASNTFLHVQAQGNSHTRTQPTPTLAVNAASYGPDPNDAVQNTEFVGPNVESSGVPLVPEPATIALMLAACGGGLVSRRRRS